MFKSHALTTSPAEKRNNFPMVQIAAHNAEIPIKDENWAERWCTLPKRFEIAMDKIINFDVRNDDVYVVTFMKCGTTWMTEASWLLLNDLNFEGAKADQKLRCLFLDFNGLMPFDMDMTDVANKLCSPRLIKTHMPANLLPKQLWAKRPKIIYVARNLKDTVCSSYHFIQKLKFWQGTMDEYIEDFTNNDIVYAPYWDSVVDFWKMRNEPYIFFTTYEEMKRDLPSVLQRLAKFLDKPALSEEELQKLAKHLSFDEMQANQLNAKFMRRGIVGSFKDELTTEQCKRLDDWTAKMLMKHGMKEEEIFGLL